MTKKIRISENADSAAVMEVVTRTATDLGFGVEPHDAMSITAHDGGKPVTGNATATKARVGIQVRPGRVELRSETTGAVYAGAAGVPFFTARINWRSSKLARAIKRALHESRLT